MKKKKNVEKYALELSEIIVFGIKTMDIKSILYTLAFLHHDIALLTQEMERRQKIN